MRAMVILFLLLGGICFAADGDKIAEGNGWKQVKLLDAKDVSATTNGVWVESGPYATGLLDISGVASAAVFMLCGSNAATKPANTVNCTTSADGLLFTSGTGTAANAITPLGVGSAVSTTPMIPIPRWIKLRASTLGTGTVTAIIVLRSIGRSP